MMTGGALELFTDIWATEKKHIPLIHYAGSLIGIPLGLSQSQI